jgi:hypothetical protein
LEALDSAFVTNVVLPIADCQASDAHWTQLEIKQVVGGSAYFVDLFAQSINGEVIGDCCPPSVAWTFRYQRTQLGRRHGYKRIPGVAESSQAGGLVQTGFAATLNAAAAAMEADLVPISGISLRPVVLHRMLNGQEVNPPVPQDIEGVHFSHIGTQNSRKYGRGR